MCVKKFIYMYISPHHLKFADVSDSLFFTPPGRY